MIFSKNQKNSLSIWIQLGFQLKSILRANFFDFSKQSINFKTTHRNRILSQEVIKQLVRQVFAYTSILNLKKNSPGSLNPPNPPLNGAQKRVFSNFQKNRYGFREKFGRKPIEFGRFWFTLFRNRKNSSWRFQRIHTRPRTTKIRSCSSISILKNKFPRLRGGFIKQEIVHQSLDL